MKSTEENGGGGVESEGERQLEPVAGDAADGHHENLEPSKQQQQSHHRDARQFYQPFVAYQPYPQRRAYKGPGMQLKKKPMMVMRTKPGRRARPSRRRPVAGGGHAAAAAAVVPMQMAGTGRYRRLPPPVRTQQVNYIDTAAASGGSDYEDGYESAPVDYGDFDHEAYAFGQPGAMQHMGGSGGGVGPVIASSGRSRKRPIAYAPEEPQAVVHVPVRVQARPVAALFPTPVAVAATSVPTTTTADPMEKLRQLVHEAMDEHFFANRHQGLYADGFGKQPVLQYSAKYKRQQQAAADRDKQDKVQDFGQSSSSRTTTAAAADAVKSDAPVKKDVHGSTQHHPQHSSPDAEADGSDDRLTLAEISAYMGAKPAETVLSAGGHRYVLSDALQQSYRNQQQQHQQHQQYNVDDQRDHHQQQYLRYVSPFEAVYELPVVPRWMYK